MIKLSRHRLTTLLSSTNWSVWYTADPRLVAGSGAEIESKSFDKTNVIRLGSSKRLGVLYREIDLAGKSE